MQFKMKAGRVISGFTNNTTLYLYLMQKVKKPGKAKIFR